MSTKGHSVRQLQNIFNCGKTQVYDTLKNQNRIKEEWLKGNGKMIKAMKHNDNEIINNEIRDWFVAVRAKNIPVSGPIIQEKAREIASNDVNIDSVNEWKSKISEYVKDYDACNIYNCDETGLFFRAIPNKTLKLKGEQCKGGKLSKERLTVLLCGNMVGDMEKPLVIGKSVKPRCFKNLDVSKLPVIWCANKKAWMAGSIMENWLIQFNNRLIRENRKIILFLDNASSHPKLILSNLKLAWFPPNTTSLTQPMDQGIIYCVKIYDRRFLMQSLIANIDQINSTSEISKKITVLDAIQWLDGAVKLLKRETIKACFTKAGFTYDDTNGTHEIEKMNEHIKENISEMNLTVDENNVNDFLIIDTNLVTESQEMHSQNDCESNSSGDEEEVMHDEMLYSKTSDSKESDVIHSIKNWMRHAEARYKNNLLKQKDDAANDLVI
ncbi:tigger transposable element-derived protein 6-like [Acyrthosiphon pisum]|uniref:HTH CENPB-type domain-containing protein n=1 Tax=Acyrthosiphon pisum TaxID=7029 RepID=A0A8R1WYN7_ACYPI|nr:tigger transposable element-derived protein 6-like [Acyrthosiphon pisum]|eukprot:XP_008179833.1 PREDICTED: tigger transposable element-derived protein 6-like [Acyrthosiphon pisum]